jgi:methylase of polypeptide subunit release factors
MSFITLPSESRDDGWDFSKANTKEYTHAFHIYPAMMIPQIARRIISDVLTEHDRIILDPYCGSGTSLVEANIAGKSAIGIDINPLALMIASAKVTPIDPERLDRQLDAFVTELHNDFPHFDSTCAFPAAFNRTICQNNVVVNELDFWFPSAAQIMLLKIKHYIAAVPSADIRNFFKVAFSETIRDVSYLNKGGYKRHRMKDIASFHPDTAKLMQHKLERNRTALQSFASGIKNYDLTNEFYEFNTIHTVEPLRHRQIDAVVTSPPYGDSRTTVAYGEFSSLTLQWLGYDDAKRLDAILMGGGKPPHLTDASFPSCLNDIIAAVACEDTDRAGNVAAFYTDYSRSIGNVAGLIKPGGYAAYVVGNRIVKNHQLPTDVITAHFFQQHGFDHVTTHMRNIPTKRMPRANSPTNEIGKTVSTMNEEYIVIMRKRL